jgi:hypothetical protein
MTKLNNQLWALAVFFQHFAEEPFHFIDVLKTRLLRGFLISSKKRSTQLSSEDHGQAVKEFLFVFQDISTRIVQSLQFNINRICKI